jgi:hypothetical protein
MILENSGTLSPVDAGTTLTDRRRPGRVDFQNPHLVGLLRDSGEPLLPAEAEERLAEPAIDADEHDDPLGPARGILLGMLIASGMWVAGGLAVWWLF